MRWYAQKSQCRAQPPALFRRVGARLRVRHRNTERATWTWSYNWTAISLSAGARSEEHTSELQSLMRISYAVFCLKKKKKEINKTKNSKLNRTRYVNI